MPPTTSLDASKRPAITSSLTPLALAPGVLNTTIPLSAHLSSGILLTPAPARAIALTFVPSSISCILALLTSTTSASLISSVTVYFSSKPLSPTLEIGLRQLYLMSILQILLFEFLHKCN